MCWGRGVSSGAHPWNGSVEAVDRAGDGEREAAGDLRGVQVGDGERRGSGLLVRVRVLPRPIPWLSSSESSELW